MSFWAFCVAAPKYWHTLGFGTHQLLRKTPVARPYTLASYGHYRPLTIDDMPIVCNFLRNHYGDTDWYLDAQESWLEAYLRNPDILFLGLFSEQELHATIMSTPLTKGSTFLGSNLPKSNVRVIECLCVHRQHRKRGLAAYMISAMDHETSKQGPHIHLYSRELHRAPILSTHLNAKRYGYIVCDRAMRTCPITQMSYVQFSDLWKSNAIHWTASNHIVASLPMNT